MSASGAESTVLSNVIVELLGVPEQDEWRILKLTNELFAGDDPEMRRVGADPLSIFETVKDLYEYFDRMTEERRARRRVHPDTRSAGRRGSDLPGGHLTAANV